MTAEPHYGRMFAELDAAREKLAAIRALCDERAIIMLDANGTEVEGVAVAAVRAVLDGDPQ